MDKIIDTLNYVPELINCNLETSIFVAEATLLLLTTTRNIHLSERARSIIHRYGKCKNEDHKKILKTQKDIFISRYQRTSYAFFFFLFALIFSVVLRFSKTSCIELSIQGELNNSYIFLSWIWIIFLSVGFLLLVLEFIKGRRTLELEDEIVDPKEDMKNNPMNEQIENRNNEEETEVEKNEEEISNQSNHQAESH